MPPPSQERLRRPGLVRRAAAGAWHVPAGFGILLRSPGLWPLAALPVVLAIMFIFFGAVLGIFLIPRVEALFAFAPGTHLVWIELPASLLLWTAVIGFGVFLGLGVALLLASPVLDQLSRQVEERVLGTSADFSRGVAWEVGQSVRAGLTFLIAAPGVFVLGLIPLVGPFLSALWGGRAVAYQMTDPALTRRGLDFRGRWRWHRRWLPESQGFGLAGMVGLLVPFANLLLAPALVAGGTLLVLALEPLSPPETDAGRPRGEPDDTPLEGGDAAGDGATG